MLSAIFSRWLASLCFFHIVLGSDLTNIAMFRFSPATLPLIGYKVTSPSIRIRLATIVKRLDAILVTSYLAHYIAQYVIIWSHIARPLFFTFKRENVKLARSLFSYPNVKEKVV